MFPKNPVSKMNYTLPIISKGIVVIVMYSNICAYVVLVPNEKHHFGL